jgi:hypothetical protein
MEYAQPQKGKNTLLWVIVGIAGTCILLCVGGGFWGVTAFKGLMGQAFSMVGCSYDLQAARSSLKKYADAHGGMLPSSDEWQDASKQYFKAERAKLQDTDSEDVKKIGIEMKLSDPDGVWGCHLPNGKVQAFVFNEELSGKKLSEIKDGTTTILLWEGSDSGRNLKGKYVYLKPNNDMRIAGDKREFLKITVDGEFKMQSKRRGRVTIESSTSSN